ARGGRRRADRPPRGAPPRRPPEHAGLGRGVDARPWSRRRPVLQGHVHHAHELRSPQGRRVRGSSAATTTSVPRFTSTKTKVVTSTAACTTGRSRATIELQICSPIPGQENTTSVNRAPPIK